jgi:hypothetical protein
VKPFVPTHTVPPFKGKFPHRDHPLAANAGRVVELKFVRASKEPDLAPMFSMKNLTDKPVDVGQTWLFYYDAEKKKTDRYPHSLGYTVKLGPGEAKEQRLGQNTEKIEAGLTLFEGEVTSARVDGNDWENQNLNPMPRPAGGVDAQTLADNAGVRLVVDVYELSSYRVRLTNVTDRVIKDAVMVFHYRGEKDENTKVTAGLPDDLKPIAPGASVDLAASAWSSSRKSPPKATDVVAYATRVTFESGPSFENENLSEDVRWKVLGDR